MHRQGWQKRDERGWMCVRTCFYLVRACVCVQKGMQGMNKQCEVCVCSEGWVLVYLCKETPVNLSTCMCVCVCMWTEEVSVSESNTSICVPGWRLCELSSLWSSEHRHSDETKHAHAEQLSHTAESQVVAPVPLMFSLYSLFVLHKCHFRLGSTVP